MQKGRSQLIIIILLLFSASQLAYCSSKGENITEPPINNSGVDTTFCEDGTSLFFDEFIIENNTWGRGTLTNYSQCSFLKEDERNVIIGWEWQWPIQSGDNVKAYPEIVYGWKPFRSESSTQALPIEVTSNNKIISKYDVVNSTFNGIGNLAYDIWITNSPTPNASNITREIMIWIKNYGQAAGGSKVNEVEIDGIKYDFYKADWDWTYLAFVNSSGHDITEVNIHNFIKYLLTENYITEEEFVSSIEFGNEIIEGTGKTEIVNYQVIIE
ncbi:MAG: hypothetical protein M5R37_13890 [Melioribacteraceae bacterium]|nr:hypothetical protein [Melioribacteraceae bacterium]